MCIKEKMQLDLQYYTTLVDTVRECAHRAYMQEDYDAYDALYDTLAALEDVKDALTTLVEMGDNK